MQFMVHITYVECSSLLFGTQVLHASFLIRSRAASLHPAQTTCKHNIEKQKFIQFIISDEYNFCSFFARIYKYDCSGLKKNPGTHKIKCVLVFK